MRGALPLLAALVLTGLAPLASAEPPADAFCVITIEPTDGFRLVRVVVDEETTLEERRALWPHVDLDGDLAVTPGEKVTWQRTQVAFHDEGRGLAERAISRSLPGGEGERPLYVATWREVGHTFHQRDYRTPDRITDPADLETQAVREARFATNATGRVYLQGGLDLDLFPVPAAPPEPQTPTTTANGTTTSTTTTATSVTTTITTSATVTIEYVVVRAPPGWVVGQVRGHSYDGPVEHQFGLPVAELPAFDTKRPYSIEFVQLPAGEATSSTTQSATPSSETRGSPMALWVALAAAALVAVLARRRA